MMLKIMMIPIMKFQQSTPNTLFYTINIYQTCLFHQISLLNMQRFRGKQLSIYIFRSIIALLIFELTEK